MRPRERLGGAKSSAHTCCPPRCSTSDHLSLASGCYWLWFRMSTMPEPCWTHMEPPQPYPCHLLCQVSLGRWCWWRGPAHLRDSERGGLCLQPADEAKWSTFTEQRRCLCQLSLRELERVMRQRVFMPGAAERMFSHGSASPSLVLSLMIPKEMLELHPYRSR